MRKTVVAYGLTTHSSSKFNGDSQSLVFFTHASWASVSKTLAHQLRNPGLDCPETFNHAVPAEGIDPDAEPEGPGALPARAGGSEVVIVPPEAEEIRNTKAELAKVRDQLMTHRPKGLSCQVCAKAKIQRRQKRHAFLKDDDDEPLPVKFGDHCTGGTTTTGSPLAPPRWSY